jgi:hypothetical protein
MNTKAEGVFIGIIISIFIVLGIYGLFWYLPHFSFGWDTGVMVGKIIGYDSNMFGTKSVFILEDRTALNGNNGLSQSQITLCSDFDDIEIHNLIEKYLNKRVIVEYKERRVGYYAFRYCHESPITNITLLKEEK